uniref:Uncharacterized protein n=1 Tax=Salarias fasciatus TaxID=181472 RepID=A0A672GIS4_SALFA
MVTDSAAYIGVDFAYNAGVGLVVRMKDGPEERGETILQQLRAAFERDWGSRYAKTLPGSKDCNHVRLWNGTHRLMQ